MGTESKIDDLMRWEIIGQLETQGRISISDSSYFYDQPIVVLLEPGKYSVSVFYSFQEGRRHIARAPRISPSTAGCSVITSRTST